MQHILPNRLRVRFAWHTNFRLLPSRICLHAFVHVISEFRTSAAAMDTHVFRWGMRDRNLVVKSGRREDSAVLVKVSNTHRFMVRTFGRVCKCFSKFRIQTDDIVYA